MASLKKAFTGKEKDIEYTPILEKGTATDTSSVSDLDFNEPVAPLPRRPSTARRIAHTSWKAVVVALALTGAALLLQAFLARLALHRSGRFVPITSPSCSCGGSTVAEAKRRGCVLSLMAISWLPPHCIDHELAEQFDRAGPGPNGEWPYWADINGTIPISFEEIGALADTEDGVFYTTQDWHVMHCAYTWQKHYRSRWTGVTIERRSNGLDHIAHCLMIARMPFGLQEIATVAGIALDADFPGDDGIHGEESKGDKFEISY